MKNGDLTVEDYAKSLLSRINERDHVVKAWAFLDPDFVLIQAKKLDEIPAEKRGPLHGIAIGVKDVILTKGISSFHMIGASANAKIDMPTGHNSDIYRNQPPAMVDAA
jgi:Asp-tRNA(Asn)/Glu-tRNA(Gln) amidotransferase A subunit family amidase